MARLALTIGDPTGIGPEIAVKALQQLDAFPGLEVAVIGNKASLIAAASSLALSIPTNIHLHDISGERPGAVAYQSIEAGVRLIKDGKADALVTGPISKKNLHDAGHAYAGHTEILEALARQLWDQPTARAEMLFSYKDFRLLLLTRHIPIGDVPAALMKSGAVAKPVKILISFLRKQLKIDMPRIAMLGLNPHAGEIGGEEENEALLPVIKAVNAIGGSQIDGPFAADGFFRGFRADRPGYDAVVAAYHDQGLIPFKLLSGYEAVNVTIGLPFLRTSVSHGTAEDIVGKGVAREDSLIAAMQMALKTL